MSNSGASQSGGVAASPGAHPNPTNHNEATDDLDRENIARAPSIPEHHTTWDLLTEPQKNRFRMQAGWAIAVMTRPGEKHTDLITSLPVEDWAEDMIARREAARQTTSGTHNSAQDAGGERNSASDMVERVAFAMAALQADKPNASHTNYATTALEASHHADLVSLLRDARWYVRESLCIRIDAALAKIGGDA